MFGVLAVAFAAHAQKVYRIGYVMSTAPVSEATTTGEPTLSILLAALRARGYVEGKNLVMEWRSAEGKFERFPEIMRELISLKVDVIVSVTNPSTLAAKNATRTVPIVMLASVDPVENGLVQSLARPGGNVTGLTVDTGPENLAKQLQLLKEIIPGMTRVAYLVSKEQWQLQWKESIQPASAALGVEVLLAAHTPTNYADAFALISRERPHALLVALNPQNFVNRKLIIDFAAKNRLPAAYPMRDFGEAGGLIAQGVDLGDIARRTAGYVDRILKGAKPADLPIERPTKFDLVINLRTAKSLGISIPQSLLVRADHVIQ